MTDFLQILINKGYKLTPLNFKSPWIEFDNPNDLKISEHKKRLIKIFKNQALYRMVIWITGLSASGKTTLAKYFKTNMKKKNYQFTLVDGDNVRDIFFNDLGFDEKSRFKQITRMQEIAKFLDDENCNVIVAALYSHPKLLNRNRKLFKNYFEIYLKANINFLAKRETKKIYFKAINKKIKNVVGIDIKWHVPMKPNLIFDQKNNYELKQMFNLIYKKIKTKKLYYAQN